MESVPHSAVQNRKQKYEFICMLVLGEPQKTEEKVGHCPTFDDPSVKQSLIVCSSVPQPQKRSGECVNREIVEVQI